MPRRLPLLAILLAIPALAQTRDLAAPHGATPVRTPPVFITDLPPLPPSKAPPSMATESKTAGPAPAKPAANPN